MSKYRLIKVGGKWIKEHRHIMETILDRKLLPIEYVHHINGKKDDNDPKNLMIVDKHTHYAIHAKVGFEKAALKEPAKVFLKHEILPPLLTLHEAAQMVHRSNATLREWSRQGKIKSIIISTRGDKRFKKQDIEAFINNKHHE